MDKKTACLTQAAICRRRAKLDFGNNEHWLREAQRWERLAAEPAPHVAITHEVHNGRMMPKVAVDTGR